MVQRRRLIHRADRAGRVPPMPPGRLGYVRSGLGVTGPGTRAPAPTARHRRLRPLRPGTDGLPDRRPACQLLELRGNPPLEEVQPAAEAVARCGQHGLESPTAAATTHPAVTRPTRKSSVATPRPSAPSACAKRGGNSCSSSRGGAMRRSRRTYGHGRPSTEYRVPKRALMPSARASSATTMGRPATKPRARMATLSAAPNRWPRGSMRRPSSAVVSCGRDRVGREQCHRSSVTRRLLRG